MKKETDELLTDVLAEETQLREKTLELGLDQVRRVRRRRHTMRVAGAICLPILVLAAAIRVRDFSATKNPTPGAVAHVTEAEKTIPGTSIRVLNDEELLELFKGRPVALIGPAGHQQLIVFDEIPN